MMLLNVRLGHFMSPNLAAAAVRAADPIRVAAFCFCLFSAAGTHAQQVTTIAGTGAAGYAGDGGPATSALLNEPQGIGRDGQGNVYFADNLNFVIRRIDTNGVITTVAGNGTQGFSGDNGPATLASLGSPVGIHVKPDGSVLIADMSNHRVRLVDAGLGAIFTIAGNGTLGFSGDGGPATSAKLNTPQCVAADPSGNVYIADTANLRIRLVDAGTGTITTICGIGFPGSGGDGGLAIAASLTSPRRLTLDSANNIFVLDRAANARIRRIDGSTGIITTVAGGGALTGDSGPATEMNLGPLTDVAVFGNDLIVTASFRVWEIDSGTATAVGGTGAQGFSGDGGNPLLAVFNNISGATVNPLGEIFLTDRSNQRIRKIGFAPALTGACCYGANCLIELQASCLFNGGTYLGHGTACNAGSCALTGACCMGTTCSIMTEAECFNQTGTYAGDSSTCFDSDGDGVADECEVSGDINGDGVVNVSDLLAVINSWGACPMPPAACPADVAPAPNGDGVVNVSDLLFVINNWG